MRAPPPLVLLQQCPDGPKRRRGRNMQQTCKQFASQWRGSIVTHSCRQWKLQVNPATPTPDSRPPARLLEACARKHSDRCARYVADCLPRVGRSFVRSSVRARGSAVVAAEGGGVAGIRLACTCRRRPFLLTHVATLPTSRTARSKAFTPGDLQQVFKKWGAIQPLPHGSI